jgi:pimeloyl-ACP methyl ester carboxylesterase
MPNRYTISSAYSPKETVMPKLTRDDVTLHYEVDGVGQPIVYISGFSDHSNSLFSEGMRKTLSEKGQFISVDNRGSGQTVTPENAPVSTDAMADDVAAVMDALNIPSAPVLGISMGGAIAMTLALRHPAKVRSLVVAVSLAAAPTPPARSTFMLETVQHMYANNLPPELINRYTAVFLLSEATFQHERFMTAWMNAPLDPFRQTRQGFDQQTGAMNRYDIRDELASIRVPTFVVSSPDDLLVPPRFQDEIAAGIPNAEMKRYPGGHIFMGVPMYREPFFRDVFAFWDKHIANG